MVQLMKRKHVCCWFAALTALLAPSAFAQGILFYPRADGSAAGVDVGTATIVKTISAAAFAQGANPGAARNVAFDPVTRLMWYSATDGQIYSVNIDTLTAGPSVTGIPGANPGGERHLFIDYKRRNIWTSQTDGSIALFSLATQQSAGTVPPNFFVDGNVGGFRHFASDQRSGLIWYAATDGSFVEMDPDTVTRTGRTISFAQQIGANPGAFRHFVVDPLRDLLLYSVTDGRAASVNLSTLTKGTFEISSAVFTGGNVGAGRTLTYDIQPIALAPTFNVSGGTLSLSWGNLGPTFSYTLLFRTDLLNGSWTPVTPTNQWPTAQTSSPSIPLTLPAAYYRLHIHPGSTNPP